VVADFVRLRSKRRQRLCGVLPKGGLPELQRTRNRTLIPRTVRGWDLFFLVFRIVVLFIFLVVVVFACSVLRELW